MDDQPVFSVDPAATGLTPVHFLRYFYYGGIAYAGVKQWKQALDSFLMVSKRSYREIVSTIRADVHIQNGRRSSLLLTLVAHPYQLFPIRVLLILSAADDPGNHLELPCGGRVQEDGAGVIDHVRKSPIAPQVRVQRCDASPEEPYIGVRSSCNKLPG